MGTPISHTATATAQARAIPGGFRRRSARMPGRRRTLLSVMFLMIVMAVEASDRWIANSQLQAAVGTFVLAIWVSVIGWAIWDHARR